MGNCGSNPKTNESPELPEPHVTEEDKVEQKENVETNTEETPNSDNKSLATFLNERAEEAAKVEEVKGEAKAEEEKPKAEEAKTEA
ncbi:uncharacterized protein LOC109813961 [Cajanus cajan]|uniref:uncharacterized protein LOC109813961 n=1 Tax=Cajanus cajan TaxID=3821 RepID=UPI00098DC44D|nr:uncharacterized protein LOC109813961 [Cajanus cajan]